MDDLPGTPAEPQPERAKRFRVIERAVELSAGAIFRGSAAYTCALLATAAGSVVFWAIAAHVADRTTVGEAAALATLVTFLLYVTAIPLLAVVARYAPGEGRDERVVLNLSVLTASGLTAIGALVIYVVAITTRVSQAEALRSPVGAALFAAVGIGAAWSILIEIRLLAEKRYWWMIGRAVTVNLLGITLLVVGNMASSPLKLFLASNGMVALGGPVTWVLTQWRAPNWLAVRPLPPNYKAIVRFAKLSGPSTLAGQAAVTGLPVLVALTVVPSSNAQFYIAWNVTIVAFFTVQSVGNALLVEGGRGGDSSLSVQVRQSRRLAVAIAAIVMVGMVVCSPILPVIYGPGYEGSAQLLRWLSLSLVPVAIYTVALVTARIRHLAKPMIGLPLLLALGVLLPAIPLTRAFSTAGAAGAWILGTALVGLTSMFLLRPLLRGSDIRVDDIVDVDSIVLGSVGSAEVPIVLPQSNAEA